MTRLLIPRVLQQYCEGCMEINVDGETVGELLLDLQEQHPSLYVCICDETGRVRTHINLFLNDQLLDAANAKTTRVESGDVVSVFQAVSGG